MSDLLEAVDELLAAHPPGGDDRALREARFDAGLAFVHFDVGAGGRGLDASLQAEVERRFVAAGHVDWGDRNIIGLGMAAPVIHEHGTAEQRALLRPLFTGEEVWCQLFSEPGSGSDLAGLSSRAELDGDEWVVSGQKVWTTLGHVARRGLLVARTDPDIPKHRGLTYFLLDMTSPGVDVRPLRQMTGDAEFNEVYLTDVRIPDRDRIGGVGDGWRVAMSTLMNERVSLGGGAGARGSGPIGEAVELFRAARAEGRAGAAVQDQLLRLWTRAEAVRLMNLRAAVLSDGGLPGPDGSLGKLSMAELNKAIFELCMALLGPDGMLIDTYEMGPQPEAAGVHGGGDPRRAFLRTRANSIEGGTSEILRNVLGERVLGLPGEPRGDKDLPWREVPR